MIGNEYKFVIGGSVSYYQKSFKFSKVSTYSQPNEILPANNSVTWNTASLSSKEKTYMLKV